MTIREAIMEGAALLRENGSETPFLDASLLASLALSADKSELLARYSEPYPGEPGAYRELLRRRASGEPYAYLSGRREFRSLEFEVGPGVLVPRPETEHLVEEALKAAALIIARREPHGGRTVAVHDCCTGSGCVGISLALELSSLHPDIPFRFSLSDISDEALAYARRNARRLLGEGAAVAVEKRDLLDGVPARSLDIIVANPPYLSGEEMEAVRARGEGEPETALYGGANGLDPYRALLPQALECLAEGGCFLAEIGAGQGSALRSLLSASGFSDVFVEADLAGRDRVAGGWKRG